MTRAPFAVVIVDDNPGDMAEARRLLLEGTERRYRFTEAETGAAAIAACLEGPDGPPDCVILDYCLPDMDAPRVLAALCAGGPLTICPVLVLTGGAGPLGGPAVLRAGAQDYLNKAWMNPELLARAVDNAVERHRMAREALEREATLRERDEQLRLALRDTDRRKDEFLATLAHELRNPLAPLRMGLGLLGHATAGQDTGRLREMMERQVRHLVRIIDDLLDVSRLNSGKMHLVRERIEVRRVVEAALEITRPLFDAAGHALTVRLPEAPVWIDGDLTRLAQVLGNLLNNAAKYTPQGGRVELAVEARGGEVVVRIEDNGCGIPRERLAHVFEMFTQIDRTLSRAQGGLGIGLSLVRRLVEMHGGQVAVESVGPGRGSTFLVRLPLAAPFASIATEEIPVSRRGPTRRVLVIDDNIDAAESLAELLRVSGHEAQAVHDGAEALVAARGLPPEVVFLDLGLPGMDGYEVARRLRAEPHLSGAVLVALSGWGNAEDRRRSREAGFDHHLTKPADPIAVDELLAGLALAGA